MRDLRLTPTSFAAIQQAADAPRSIPTDTRLVERDHPADGLHIVLDGVLASCVTLESGVSQTVGLYLTGDIIGLDAMALGQATANVYAVSPARLARIPTGRVKALIAEHPDIMESLWRATARQNAILQEWAIGMGRRQALGQVAHLLCEIAFRLRLAGKADERGCDFPLTQSALADAVGLSTVHVNRVLQLLRADDLIQLTRTRLRIVDWPRLAAVADFDPGYLGSGDMDAALLLPPGDTQRTREGRDRRPMHQH